MTYEKEIPDYAMVPARETAKEPVVLPEERIITPVTKGAVYSQIQATSITEKPKTVITVEEDILVPDTKPDLKEILLIDGKARLSCRELNFTGKGEDYLDLTGEIDLQTLYMPENPHQSGCVISVQTRVPFKDRWHTPVAPGSMVTLECRPEKTEYMVINERKYRVKISLAVTAREWSERKIDVFEGLAGEEIQMLKENTEITNIALRKKDTAAISEILDVKEELPVENILRQDIWVAENYKQITGEKMIINGFVYINLLYSVNDHEGQMVTEAGAEREAGTEPFAGTDHLRQAQERVEFTQFIPLTEGGKMSGCSVSFDGSGLRVKLVNDEEAGEVMRLEGDIITHAEFYTNLEKEIIVDGYHREKDFICDFKEEKCRTLMGTSTGEASIREIIVPEPAHGELERIIYSSAEIVSAASHSEQGKVITEGTAEVKMICQSRISKESEPQIFSIHQPVSFRVVTAMPQLCGGEIISDKIYIKDVWCEKINGKQIEFNGAVVVNAEVMEEKPFKVLVNPAFEECRYRQRQAPMVVYVTKKGDSLWTIAKKFKTTTETISQINHLEGMNPEEGKKLLILK